jgi:hypothetical protein
MAIGGAPTSFPQTQVGKEVMFWIIDDTLDSIRYGVKAPLVLGNSTKNVG